MNRRDMIRKVGERNYMKLPFDSAMFAAEDGTRQAQLNGAHTLRLFVDAVCPRKEAWERRLDEMDDIDEILGRRR